MGEIAVRGKTEYVLGDFFKEDLRVIPCGCSGSKVKLALADTFTARRGEDGHRSLSIARMVGPVSGSLVAYKTWYPSGTPRNEIASEIGLNYGFVFLGNLSMNRRIISRHLPASKVGSSPRLNGYTRVNSMCRILVFRPGHYR
jgi:hypothetical protein